MISTLLVSDCLLLEVSVVREDVSFQTWQYWYKKT